MFTPYLKIIGSETTGTGFFASPEYIVTCKHVIENCSAGDIVSIKFDDDDERYNAEVFRIHETADLALLKSSVSVENYYFLDRVAVPETKAELTGYPHDCKEADTTDVEIVKLIGRNKIRLKDANDATVGYSGGPLCPEKDESSVIGVYSGFNDEDKYGRRVNTGYAVPASVILDAWGEYVCEKRYQPQRKNLHKENDFVYQALKTDFTGRDAEIELLNRFVQHDNNSPLLWQAVVAEGGSGKSRLAYEFAHSLDSTWHCELVTQADLTVSKLNRIYEEAGRNLLLIADYAYTDTNELGDWIENILADTPEHDIRILMLQRQGNDPNNKSKWLESLEKKLGNVNDYMFAPEIRINRLSKDDIYIVMESYAQSKGKTLDGKECGALYEALERVDPELLRPLFAMFITDAYLEDSERPLNWKREEALEHFCERERVAINKAVSEDCQDAAQLLTVLATITGGYSFKKGELPDFDVFEATENIGYKLQKAGIAVKADKEYTVDAITPDILGEYFVKMYLETHFNDISDILDAARNNNDSVTSEFLTRLFTDHEADIDFVEKCCNNSKNSFCVSWGLILRTNVDKLASMYDRCKGSDDESFWCAQYAKGLFNRFRYPIKVNEVKKTIKKLRELHEENSGNTDVTATYARGLCISSWYLTEPEEPKNIRETLRELHEENKENAKVTEAYAANLLEHFLNLTDVKEAKKALETLRELYETNRKNAKVAAWYAMGLYNHFCDLICTEEEKKVLEKLKELYEENKENANVAVQYAKGLYKHFHYRTDAKEAKGILAELKSLHETANNDEVTVEYAKGLVGYILNHAASKAEAEECLSAADSPKEESPENEELQEFCQLAHRAFDLKFGS